MAADQGREVLSVADVQAFAQKVEAWAQDLTPKEQAFLEYILACAAEQGDTRGQAFDTFAKGAAGKFSYIEGSPLQKVREIGVAAHFNVEAITPSLLRIAGQ